MTTIDPRKANNAQNLAFRFVACLSVCLLAGCMVATGYVDSGDNLGESKVNTLQRDRTTRADILKLFGPPKSVLRVGSTAKITSGMESEEITFEIAFLPFGDRYMPSPNHVIFYYQDIATSRREAVVMFVGSAKTVIKRTRLWILLDESKDVVIDYVYRND